MSISRIADLPGDSLDRFVRGVRALALHVGGDAADVLVTTCDEMLIKLNPTAGKWLMPKAESLRNWNLEHPIYYNAGREGNACGEVGIPPHYATCLLYNENGGYRSFHGVSQRELIETVHRETGLVLTPNPKLRFK